MKPNFALALSYDGIRLLHRAFPGWQLIGEVALTVPDLAGELATLRRTATQLDKSGLRSKLIIPNDQIRYIEVETGDLDSEARRARALEVLSESTPYSLEQLIWDISEDGARTLVAATARDTLAEAESFAAQHGFNPVSWVAVPPEGTFAREVFFGETEEAAQYLDPDDRLEHDDAPVRVIGKAELPPPPAPQPEPAEIEPAATRTAEPPKPRPANDDERSRALRWFAAGERADSRTPPAASDDAPVADASVVAAFSSIRSRTAAQAPRRAAPAETLVAGRPPEPTDFGAQYEDEDEQDAGDDPAAAHEATQTPDSPFARDDSPPAITPPPLPEDKRARSEAERMTLFGARAPAPDAAPKPRRVGLLLTLLLLAALVGVAIWASIFMGGRVAAFFRAPLAPPAAEMALAAPAPQAPAPRVPAGVADEGDADAIVEEAVALAAPAAPAAVPTPEPDGEITLAALESGPDTDAPSPPLAQPIPRPESPAAEAAPALPDPAAPQADTPRRPTPGGISEEQAAARYAATGIWPGAPQQPRPAAPVELDDLYVASIDVKVPELDAVALPAPEAERSDTRPETLPAPAPPGTDFALDARGLVIATAEGALTPDGIVVIAGRPEVLPPQRPERLAEQEEEAAEAAQAETENRLAAFRPQSRPDDLREQIERNANAGRTLSELSSFRPNARPANIAALAARPELPEAPAISAAVDAAVADVAAEDQGTRLATAVSRKPAVRPRDLTQRDGVSQKTVQVQPQTVTPRTPSTASVAKQATVKDALNLRRINLIGVYGKPSSRRALVRLSNGRYEKVKVGDRIDGGRVSAIGEDELRYTKSGRNHVLTMPKG